MLTKLFSIPTKANFDCVNITPQVETFIKECEVSDGVVLIFSKGSTGALTTIECKEGLMNDLKDTFERLIPSDIHYQHYNDWGDDNGFSHIRSAFLQTSILIPFEDKILELGPWQHIVLLNFDTQDREREVLLRIIK